MTEGVRGQDVDQNIWTEERREYKKELYFTYFSVLNATYFLVKEWNTKYLRKLENHTNALAVNLLDNSETTHRLKRYTVLTLPDRPE
jgi:hypothetical protein